MVISKIQIFIITLHVLSAFASDASLPDPSWDRFIPMSCCPKGFIEVSNSCVQCIAPNVFYSNDQKCGPCPPGHSYNNATGGCNYQVSCQPPRQMNNNNNCQCPEDQIGTKKVWNQLKNTCSCPQNVPLWNGIFCVSCPNYTQYDVEEQQCYHCPQGFVRDRSSHSCVPDSDSDSDSDCILGYVRDQSSHVCIPRILQTN